MKQYLIKFEHSKWGTARFGYCEARNPAAAIARGARVAGLQSRRRGGHWQFWHNNGMENPNVYFLVSGV